MSLNPYSCPFGKAISFQYCKQDLGGYIIWSRTHLVSKLWCSSKKVYCFFPPFFFPFWFRIQQCGMKNNGCMALKIHNKNSLNIPMIPIKVCAELELFVGWVPITIQSLVKKSYFLWSWGYFQPMQGKSKQSPSDHSPIQIQPSYLSCRLSGFPGTSSKLNLCPNAWPWILLGYF
jgi:hypothetical protein